MIKKPTKTQLLELKKIKPKRIHEKAKTGVKTFKKEFKKATNTAIMAAFGFLIALVWKDVITSIVNNITQEAHISSAVLSALIVTAICVLGIMFFSRILKEEDEKEKKDEKRENLE